MISLKQFHQDFLQNILTDSESRGLMKAQAFFENVCEDLIISGDLTNNYTFADYIKPVGMEAYGYDYDEEREILSVLSHEFFQEDEIQTLTKSIINTKFKRLKNFISKSFQGLYREMEEASDEYSMAYNIYNYKFTNKITKIRLILLTDGKSTRNLIDLSSEIIDGIETEFRVIDIEYIYNNYLAQYIDNSFEVDVNLSCLEIPVVSDEYKSYLCVITGDQLASIYEKFGQKLLEQNVRTFLQFRGNVNKGLRNTIEYKPDMFFAYNNGITATATDVQLDSTGKIKKIVNFQIVNGGQTTSAIYAAKKKAKLDVSNVSVQMKLSIVKNKEKQNDFVSKVAEYANTQNKINKSDFFSNSPFHKEMKNYSKSIWAPVIDGYQHRTHWFYERVRGEYLNEQAYLTEAQKKKFKLGNPKSQLFDKTLLSKSENAWLQKPHIVSKGAQYSFIEFAKNVTDTLEKDELAITEGYFKDVVSRIILFRELEKMISNAEWYNGGFRAPTVAYSMSYLFYLIKKQNKFLNFNLIWEKQKLPDKLKEILSIITKKVYNNISNPPDGQANVTQWCKKEACWQRVKSIDLNIEIDFGLLIDQEEVSYKKGEYKKEKRIETGIEMQVFVVKTDIGIWQELYKYYKYRSISKISIMQLDILKKMSEGVLQPPSEKQSKILYNLYKDAEKDGVEIA